MKKLMALLACLFAVSFTLSACTKSEENAATPTPAATGASSDSVNMQTAQPFDVSHLQLAYPKATISGQEIKTVTTIAQPYSYAASLDIPRSGVPPRASVAIRLRVLKGEIGVGILDVRKNDFPSRKFVSHSAGLQTISLPLAPSSNPRQLIIENGGTAGISQVVVVAVKIVSETHVK
jgi:hypothetical protein